MRTREPALSDPAWSASFPTRIALVVPAEASGARLDRFVVAALSKKANAPSRSELQRWIDHGRVTVAGVVKRAADTVKVGSTIEIVPEPPARTDAAAEAGVVFDVLYTDDAIVVVNKPAGLVVHPAKGHASGTLVNGLLGRGLFDRAMLGAATEREATAGDATAGDAKASDAIEENATEHVRPGIVHRLDKGTSGVMVVARSLAVHALLKEQFAAHTIDREYEAICVGVVRSQRFDTLHGRHPKERLKFTSKVREGRRAVTFVELLEDLTIASHVMCRLETGRTHQIRMHLAEAQHPVLGDPLYGKPPKNEALRMLSVGLGHQALHARLLGFVHPTTHQKVTFTAAPPPDFELTLATLRGLAR